MQLVDLVAPAFESGPAYERTFGPEVADLAEMAGMTPDPEQRLALDLMFALDAHDKAAAFEFAVICCRQNMKTGLFKMAALGWLFITEQQLIVWSAHEFSTAQEAFRDMEELIMGTPFLAKLVKPNGVKYANGKESIELRTGQRLKFKARTKAGGRGLTGDKVVLDEAFALEPAHLGALMPTLSVRPDPQIVYGSSAGLETSEALRRIRNRGRSGRSPRLAYLEWCAPQGGCQNEHCTHELGVEGCALDDVDNWHRANPLLGRPPRANGTALTVEYVAAEREGLSPGEFARERLGWWDEDGTAAAFGAGRWEACASPERPKDLKPGALAVAVSFDLAYGAIAAAARDADGLLWLRPLEHGRGTDWMVDAVATHQKAFDVPVVVDRRGPAAVLLPHLEDAKIDVRIADSTDVCDAYDGIYTAVRDGLARHPDNPVLNRAVAGAVPRSIGDRTTWGRKVSTSDISLLEAVTLAAWEAKLPVVPPVEAWGFMR